MAQWDLLRSIGGRQGGSSHEEHGAVGRPMDELQEAMDNPRNIRCICLLGDRGHGKSSLVRLLQNRFALKLTDDTEQLCVPPQLPRGAEEKKELADAQTISPTTRLEVHTFLFPGDERPDANDKPRDILGVLSSRIAKGSIRTNRMSAQVMSAMSASSVKQNARDKIKAQHLANAAAADGPQHGRGPRKTVTHHKEMLNIRSVLEPKTDDEDEIRTMAEAMLCYVVDTPGHADFMAESLSGLRLADSALLLVDATEGMSAHTEKLIRRSVSQQCHLSLIISGFDHCLIPGAGAEYLENVIRDHVRAVNSVVSSCPREPPEDGNPGVQAEAGQLVFGSLTQGWLLSLGRLSRHFCTRYGLKEDVMCQKLWSEVGEDLKEVPVAPAQARSSKLKFADNPHESRKSIFPGALKFADNPHESRKSIFPGAQAHPNLPSMAQVAQAATAMKKGLIVGSTPSSAGTLKRGTVIGGDQDAIAAGLQFAKRGTVHLVSDTGTRDEDSNMKKRATLRSLPNDADSSHATTTKRQTVHLQSSQDEAGEGSPSRPKNTRSSMRLSMSRRSSRRKSAQRRRTSGVHALKDGKMQFLTIESAMPEQLIQVSEEGLVACAVGGALTFEARDSRPHNTYSASETAEMKEKPKPSLLRSLVLDPLVQLVRMVDQKDWGKVNTILKGLGASEVLEEEKETLTHDILLAKAMCRLADGAGAEEVLKDFFFLKLPAPSTAQVGICERLFLGPADSEHAESIHSCNPSGALIISVVRLLPSMGVGDQGGGRRPCYALGRVFSGTTAVGSRVCIDCAESSRGIDGFDARAHEVRIAEVEAMAAPAGSFAVPLSSINTVPAGNLVLLRGPEQFLSKSGTLLDQSIDISSTTLIPLDVAAAAPPQVRVSVRPADAVGLPKLVAALKQLNKADPVAICRSEEWGEHLIAGTGEAHLDCCLQELRRELIAQRSLGAETEAADVDLVLNKPGAMSGRKPDTVDVELPSWAHFSVPYCETVCGASGSACRTACADDSPPASFEATALQLGEQLSAELEDGLLFLGDRPRQRGLLLAERYGWDAEEGCHIWCFGPRDGCGTNAFLDLSTSFIGPDASCGAGPWPAITAACRWASAAGGLCEEPLRGVRFRLGLQCSAETNSLNWPPGSAVLEQQRWRRNVGDAAHRCLLAAQVDHGAVPGLQEPIMKAHIMLRASPWSSVEILRQAVQGKRRVEFVAGWEESEHRRGDDGVEGSPAMLEDVAENLVVKPPMRLTVSLPRLEALGLERLLQDALPQENDAPESPFVSVQTAFSHWETLPGSLSGECPDSEYLRGLVLGLRRWRQLKSGLPEMADFLPRRVAGSDDP